MSEKAGPELDRALAGAMGWKECDYEKHGYERGDDPVWVVKTHADGLEELQVEFYPSTDVATAISAAEEMRKAGRIERWNLHSGPDGMTAQTVLSGPVVPRFGKSSDAAHALTLALVAALSAEPVESMKGGAR
jgi:hypothetical protein